jgi:hypothetical protein
MCVCSNCFTARDSFCSVDIENDLSVFLFSNKNCRSFLLVWQKVSVGQQEELEWEIKEYGHFRTIEIDEMQREVFFLRTNKDVSELKRQLHEGDDVGFFSRKKLDSLGVAKPHLEIIVSYYGTLHG